MVCFLHFLTSIWSYYFYCIYWGDALWRRKACRVIPDWRWCSRPTSALPHCVHVWLGLWPSCHLEAQERNIISPLKLAEDLMRNGPWFSAPLPMNTFLSIIGDLSYLAGGHKDNDTGQAAVGLFLIFFFFEKNNPERWPWYKGILTVLCLHVNDNTNTPWVDFQTAKKHEGYVNVQSDIFLNIVRQL